MNNELPSPDDMGFGSITSDRVARIIESFDRELGDDYVGIWQIAKRIRRDFPQGDLEATLDRAAVVMRGLIETGAVLGQFQDGEFVAWDPDGALERALEAWRRQGLRTQIGEIGWFARE